MLIYSCANSYLFNRIHWLLVNITLLYLLSNKELEQFTLIFILFMQLFFFTAFVASMEATPLRASIES